MAHLTVTMLNELNVHKENATVKVRIIRLWIQPVIKNPNETYAKEMVLIDEQGNKMMASVFKNCLHLFDNLLVENDCFFIKNLKITEDLSTYKYVDNPLKATFTPRTRITSCSDFSGPNFGFEFTNFDLLIRNLLPQNKTIDVIGYIESYFPIKDVVKKDLTSSKRMSLVLKDGESRRIDLTLWDSYAEQMSNYLLTHTTDSNVVIILNYGIFKFWEGRAGVSNSYHITKLYINADICDINLFKKNLLDSDTSISRSTVPCLKTSLDDDFLKNTQLNHIAEIQEIKEEMSVIVVGTVMPISKHTKWYYDSCKICKSQLTEETGDVQSVDIDVEDDGKKLYYCKKCDKQIQEAGKRYKIHINVQDQTGVVDLLLWDWEANKILKKSAETLYQEIINGDADLFPKDLKKLEDQRFGFKINITSYNLRKNNKLYTVSKSTQDNKILNELQKKLNVGQCGTSDVGKSMSNDKQLEKTSLKRNVIEIYQDDVGTEQPPTKTRPTTEANDDLQGKDNLFTPKQEK